MSVVCILTPVVIASWPAFSSAVVAAAASLGYTAVDAHLIRKRSLWSLGAAPVETGAKHGVDLEIPQSELVTDSLDRGQKISVGRDGVTVTFSRDARGRAALRVEGCGHEDETLRAIGEELSRRVVQKYVYQRLMDEMKARNFLVVEEAVSEDASIRLRVRHWDN